MDIPALLIQHPWVLIGFAFWDMVWNGIALYKAARQGQKKWFVALLIVNSVGILPITYLLLERKKRAPKHGPKSK